MSTDDLFQTPCVEHYYDVAFYKSESPVGEEEHANADPNAAGRSALRNQHNGSAGVYGFHGTAVLSTPPHLFRSLGIRFVLCRENGADNGAIQFILPTRFQLTMPTVIEGAFAVDANILPMDELGYLLREKTLLDASSHSPRRASSRARTRFISKS